MSVQGRPASQAPGAFLEEALRRKRGEAYCFRRAYTSAKRTVIIAQSYRSTNSPAWADREAVRPTRGGRPLTLHAIDDNVAGVVRRSSAMLLLLSVACKLKIQRSHNLSSERR